MNSLGRSVWLSLLAVLACAVFVSSAQGAEPLPLTNDIAPLPKSGTLNGLEGAGLPPFTGEGFTLMDASYVSRASYTLRLVANGQNVEALRGVAEQAAKDVEAASGVPIVVAAGTVPDTVPDREPANGEILMSVDDSTPCGSGYAGCGGPRKFSVRPADQMTVVEGGRMWIYSVVLGYTTAQQQHVVEHELGHALGLAHYNASFVDGFQVMHESSYDASSYRAGDRNGLSYMARPAEVRWMSVAPRASDNALVACLGTKFGTAGCSAPLWINKAGSDAAITTLGDGQAAVAFNSFAGELGQCWVTNFLGANCWSSGMQIASGTSPAVATLTGGAASGTAVAGFNSPSGALQTCRLTSTGPVNCANHGWVLASGSSPSVAPFGDGSMAVAFRGAGNQLSECRVTWFGGSNCWSSGLPMAAGTVPGIARLTAGASAGSAIAAFQMPSGALGTCLLTTTGPANCANQGWVLASGSSPTVAPLSDGSVAVGFNGAGGQFSQCRVTDFGGSSCWSSGIAMTVGTTPSITTLASGTAMAAFRLSSGSLGTCQLTVAGPVNCANHGWTVAAGSNPSASPFRNEYSAAVVFRGGSNQLSFCRVTDFGGSNCWAQPQSLATFANPKVTSIP